MFTPVNSLLKCIICRLWIHYLVNQWQAQFKWRTYWKQHIKKTPLSLQLLICKGNDGIPVCAFSALQDVDIGIKQYLTCNLGYVEFMWPLTSAIESRNRGHAALFFSFPLPWLIIKFLVPLQTIHVLSWLKPSSCFPPEVDSSLLSKHKTIT